MELQAVLPYPFGPRWSGNSNGIPIVLYRVSNTDALTLLLLSCLLTDVLDPSVSDSLRDR